MVKFGSPARSSARFLRRRPALQAAVSVAVILLATHGASGLRAAPLATAPLVAAPVATAQTTQDLNGDGRVDAVFTQKQRYNQVCFGNGTGAFTTCSDLIGAGLNVLSNQVNTTASTQLDWDGDGDLDIALAMEGRSSVVCHNDGGGDFNNGLGCVEVGQYAQFPYNSEAVASGDLDGDGAADLVFANGGNAGLPLDQPNLVCLGGTGVCARFGSDAASTGAALGDIDGDGDLDALISNRGTLNEVCLGNGRTVEGYMNFDCRAIPQAGNVSATKVSNAVAVGNLPGGFGVTPDGFLDVVFGNDGRNERCFGSGDWSGTNVGLSCSGYNAVSSYTLNDANARTTAVIVADIRPGSSGAYVGDEILFVNEDAPNVRCFGAFTCSFEFNQKQDVNVEIGGTMYTVSEPIVENTTGVAVRDINIDGKLDVVVANTGVVGGVSRTYFGTVFDPVTAPVANSVLYPTSVTLSGGDVGPSLADTEPPAFFGATNRTAEATGPSGATVTFSVTSQDLVDGSRPVTCAPASGSLFALGNTTVTCTASDLSGNVGTAPFVVSVVDTTAPVVTVPANMSVLAPAGQTTTAVTFQASAVDLVDGVVEAFCFVNTSGVFSGDQFAGGARTVHCGAYDSRKNYSQSSFTLTVVTDIDSDGILDDVDLDDDGDGIADTVDTQPIAYSSEYRFDATNTGTVTRNGWTITIAPTAAGSAYAVRATLSGAGTAPAIIPAYCGYVRKELRLDASGETIDWRCVTGGHAATNSLAVNFVSGTAEFWKNTAGSWIRITPTAGNTAATAGSPVTSDASNTAPVLVTIFDEGLIEIGSFSLDAGESVDVEVVEVNGEPTLQLEVLNGGTDGIVEVTLFGQVITLQSGGGPATFGLGLTCAAGSYLASPIDTSCTLAQPGTYVAVEGASAADACAVGTYQPDAGQTSCLSAPLGTFVSTTGAVATTTCAVGTFSDVTGAETCQLAPAGSFVSTAGATAAVPCAAGTFSATAGSSSCTLATAGYFTPTPGASAQTACIAGSFSSAAGATACTPAPAGSYVNTSAATGSLLCPAGTFSATAGSASCTPAGAGFFVPNTGATSQTACPAGYGSAGGATECSLVNNDTDGDGVVDNDDAFPNSNRAPLVSVGTCSTTVTNQLLPSGATFNDLLAAASAGADANHGALVQAVTQLANGWKSAGLISGRDHGMITSCVARSKSGKSDKSAKSGKSNKSDKSGKSDKPSSKSSNGKKSGYKK